MPPLKYSRAVTSEPAVEPVSVEDAKRNADEDDNARDTDFALWITEARRRFEDIAQRSLITQTQVLKLDSFPDVDHIELPRPPLQSVSSIQYVDSNGDTQTFSSSSYTVDTARTPGAVFLAYNESWPTARDERNAVTITYVCGYGTSPDDVPPEARAAIHFLVRSRYENPNSADMPAEFMSLAKRLAWGAYL